MFRRCAPGPGYFYSLPDLSFQGRGGCLGYVHVEGGEDLHEPLWVLAHHVCPHVAHLLLSGGGWGIPF